MFVNFRFPLVYMGFLYSAGMLIAALIGSLQYALFVAVQNVSSGDPFWVSKVCHAQITRTHARAHSEIESQVGFEPTII